MKHFSAVIAICAVLAGCAQPPRDLRPMQQQLDDAANAHDMDAVMKLVADDGAVKDPMGEMHNGKDAIRTWMQSLMPGFRVESKNIRQSGDTLMWESTIWADAFAQTGVNPVGATTMAVFSGDRIKFFNPVLNAETQGKMKFAQFYVDVVEKKNVDAIDNYIADQFTEHQMLPPGMPSGREGVKAYFRMMEEGFPDLKVTPVMFLADGNRVLAYTKWEGTNSGRFMGKPATNRKVSFDVMDIIAISDGKATEHWGLGDSEAMMRQLAGK